MKLLLGTACAALLIACGGGAKNTAEPEPKKSACAGAADHVATVLVGGQQVPADQSPAVIRVVTERCEADRWPDEVVACLNAATDFKLFEGCAKQLTEEQHHAVLEQLEREVPIEHRQEHDKEAPADEVMPPPAPPGGGGRAPDDPCGGGA